MRERIAEQDLLVEQPLGVLRLRVDLHGVSVSGPAEERTAIRWEWITGMDVTDAGVVVRSSRTELTLPTGAFGLSPAALYDQLQRAQSIMERPEVIGGLVHGSSEA